MTTTNERGRVALVTGGSRGIGAAIVRRLAQDGLAVAFTYVRAADQAEALVAEVAAAGGQALAIRADAQDAAAIQAAVGTTVAELGGLDVLVNNAGLLAVGPVDGYPLADFDAALAVNVRAPFVATQAAVPHMQAGGRVIMIGSCVADRAAYPGSSVYALTKAAIAGFTRGLARDLGPRGITAVNVQPGPTETDMNPDDGQRREWLRSASPVGRMADGAEIAGFVAFLAGPDAGYINGASLTIDGGFTA